MTTGGQPSVNLSTIFVIVIISILFGMGVFTYALALFSEANLQAPFYVKLGTWGAMLSIAATFLAVFYTCFKDLVNRR